MNTDVVYTRRCDARNAAAPGPEIRTPGQRVSTEARLEYRRKEHMRVLVITKVFPNELEPAYASYNLNQFAALAKKCSVEVHALVPWFPGRNTAVRLLTGTSSPRIPRSSLVGPFRAVHPRVLYVPRFGRALSGLTYAGSLLPYVPSRRGKVDVVLGSFAYPDGWAAVAIGRLLGVPTVVKVHGSDINVYSRDAQLVPRLREVFTRAAAVVGPSQALVDAAITLGANPNTSRAIGNGVDQNLFRIRDQAQCRRNLDRSVDRRVILFVGRLEPAKGIFELLDAFESIARERRDVDLVLIGDGVAEAECRDRVARGNLAVHFAGRCDRTRVAEWVSAADLLTLPSWNEGTPNVVLEALASGRRVVASDVGGIPAAVHSPVLGEVVPARSAVALASALERVLDEPYDPEEVVAGASLLTWEQSGNALHEVLTRALSSR